MAFRFEFDAANKILLARWEGRLSDELLAENQAAMQKALAVTDARACIADYSSFTEFALTGEGIRLLANREMPGDAIALPRVVVAAPTVAFGMARMFQTLGEFKRADLQVVRTLDEAFAALGLHSPHFEPLT